MLTSESSDTKLMDIYSFEVYKFSIEKNIVLFILEFKKKNCTIDSDPLEMIIKDKST